MDNKGKSLLYSLLSEKTEKSYSCAFFAFGPHDTSQTLQEKLAVFKAQGLHSIIASYENKNAGHTVFDDEYYTALSGLASACGELDMTFWLEDYSPFPTGSANGAYRQEEHAGLNKLFIDERHIDICGPVENGLIKIDALQNVVYAKAIHRFAKVDPAGRQRIGVVACRMLENPADAAAPFIEDDTAVCLDSKVENGILKWSVPEGYWRIFVLFTTYESSGRPYFMNLLSRESVALELEMVHKPLYRHLKNELGKTWKGFFYDEPEIGNAGGASVFDFFMLPGRRSENKTDCNVYPWSGEMPGEMEKRDKEWLLKLPCLWYDSDKGHGRLRSSYMDAVSSLVRDNYNGQVYKFCKDNNIGYIGHVLEDENCHTRLGCGPGHYFRQQYYQDEAGIDVIAGQILPGRDKAASWYGVVNSDGEFYHYGLAKLASSEARINPLKKNRSACETFAMYGQMGMAERKFLVDHLMVNGINRILFGEVSAYEAPGEYARELVLYTDKICGLLRTCSPVIKTAVLYHAEAEWREGEKAQPFQKAGAALARNQISYDVIPADVFSFPNMYNTDTSSGLRVNENTYGALIIPACESLPEAVAAFIGKGENNCPVFFIDCAPKEFLECIKAGTGIYITSADELAEELEKHIDADVLVESPFKQWIRYSHVKNETEDFYLLHNEAPYREGDCLLTIKAGGEVLALDPVSGIITVPDQQRLENGLVKISLYMGRYEMKILYCGGAHGSQSASGISESLPIKAGRTSLHNGDWELELPGGRVIKGENGRLPEPEAFLECDYYGKLVYRTRLKCGEAVPRLLNLGRVSDCCEVFLNGQSLGKRIAAPYLFDVKDIIRQGANELEIEVYTSALNAKNDKSIFGIPLNCLNAMPYSLIEPMGVRGNTEWIFEA